MEENKRSLIKSFDQVFKSLVSGDTYKESPPQGPPIELPSLTDLELESLKKTVHGEDLNQFYSYSTVKLLEDPYPINIEIPSVDLLSDTNICGIDGSNQRVERGAFFLLLARASIINFRYSVNGLKPYFYAKNKDLSAVVWVDGNVFKDSILYNTYKVNDNQHMIREIDNNINNLPYLVRYNPEVEDKSPSNHSLGWAVKFQQLLELKCLSEVKNDVKTVCIKDGPLFSTSISIQDTIEGLSPIYSWDKQVLIASSKKVQDSRLLVELLLNNIELRNFWFPNQQITDSTLKAIATDSLLLPRILKPGYRTPLVEAVPLARKNIVEHESRLMPLSCYYLSRKKPHKYIRLEIPKFMWERNKLQVEQAIQIVAWQHEIGGDAPLVQTVAEKQCQLNSEKNVLEKQTLAALMSNKLDFPQ